jgi:hypothetical protein
VEQQDREQRSLLGSAERKGLAVREDFKRSEQAELQGTPPFNSGFTTLALV